MSQTLVNTLITAVPWALLVVGLMIATGIDPYISRRNRRLIMTINALVMLLIVAEATEYLINRSETNDLLRSCASAYGYAARPMLLVLFMQVLYPQRRKAVFWAVTGANAAVYFLSLFTGIAFYIQNNHFHRGPLNLLCLIVSILLILDLTAQLIRTSRSSRKREMILILFSTALIAVGLVADIMMARLLVISFLTMVIVGSTIFYYLWLHLQLARLHEEKMVENLQAEHRIQLMISQIQPHFLFNTFSSIQALCEADPKRAADRTERFGQYLRENLDSLNQPKLISFEKEMKHTQTYAEIEQVRFPSIQITYDLQDVDFDVPALTVQPLVENAIRHGVRIRVNGEIHISTRREADAHIVTIQDNGKGFDAEQAFLLEGQHIGLRNVRERVEQMCHGSMIVDSRLGEGTTIILGLIALSIIAQFATQTAGVLTRGMAFTVGDFMAKFHLEYVTGYVPYLLIGWYLTTFPPAGNKKIALIAAGLAALLCMALSVQLLIDEIPDLRDYVVEMNTPPALLYGVGVFVLINDCLQARQTQGKAIKLLSKHAFGIYILHVFVLDILMYLILP